MRKITLGSDIEMFVKDKNGKIVSATTMIKNPINNHAGTITSDGIQLELQPNYNACREVLSDRINYLYETLRQLSAKKNLTISLDDCITIDDSTFKKINNKDKELGCKPDYNIYTNNTNIILDGAQDKP